mgnify:CR=1 FL=1
MTNRTRTYAKQSNETSDSQLSKRKLPISLQESLLTALIFDKEAGLTLANLVSAREFDRGLRSDIAGACIDYLKQYKRAPENHVLIELEGRLKEGQEDLVRDLFLKCQQFYKGNAYNPDYLIAKVRDFKLRQKAKSVLSSLVQPLLDERTPIEEILAPLATLVREHHEEPEPSLQVTDIEPVLEKLRSQEQEFFLGIPALERRGVYPRRGCVLLFIAPTNLGKSWALVNVGRFAVFPWRHKVLHVSLEMSSEEVVQRYWQNSHAACQNENQINGNVTRFVYDEQGRLTGLKVEELSASFAMTDADVAQKLRRVQRFLPLSHLKIETWPSGTLTVGMLRAYIEQLKNTWGTPDLLIIDYLGIMKVNTEKDQLRHQLRQILVDLRALAAEYNMAVVTAAQTNREGAKADKVRSTHLSEAFALAQDADCAITYSQNETTERPFDLARLWVDKHRQGEAKFGVVISQCYRLGQFCLESAPDPGDKAWQSMLESLGAPISESKREPELTPEQIEAVKAKLSEGKWRYDIRAARWAGKAIAEVLGLDVAQHGERCKAILEKLINQDHLEVYKDRTDVANKRNKVEFVRTVTAPDLLIEQAPASDLTSEDATPLQPPS